MKQALGKSKKDTWMKAAYEQAKELERLLESTKTEFPNLDLHPLGKWAGHSIMERMPSNPDSESFAVISGAVLPVPFGFDKDFGQAYKRLENYRALNHEADLLLDSRLRQWQHFIGGRLIRIEDRVLADNPKKEALLKRVSDLDSFAAEGRTTYPEDLLFVYNALCREGEQKRATEFARHYVAAAPALDAAEFLALSGRKEEAREYLIRSIKEREGIRMRAANRFREHSTQSSKSDVDKMFGGDSQSFAKGAQILLEGFNINYEANRIKNITWDINLIARMIGEEDIRRVSFEFFFNPETFSEYAGKPDQWLEFYNFLKANNESGSQFMREFIANAENQHAYDSAYVASLLIEDFDLAKKYEHLDRTDGSAFDKPEWFDHSYLGTWQRFLVFETDEKRELAVNNPEALKILLKNTRFRQRYASALEESDHDTSDIANAGNLMHHYFYLGEKAKIEKILAGVLEGNIKSIRGISILHGRSKTAVLANRLRAYTKKIDRQYDLMDLFYTGDQMLRELPIPDLGPIHKGRNSF